jgi:signal transduction histidine kinase
VPESVQGDAHHLEHAITAVLSNAIEFAPDSSSIDIHLGECEVEDSRYWTLGIANTGSAIPTDLHRSIFRPYFTTRQGGTGIGLAMTHRVISQHGGRIEVQSPLNAAQMTGCAFVIRVPVMPES